MTTRGAIASGILSAMSHRESGEAFVEVCAQAGRYGFDARQIVTEAMIAAIKGWPADEAEALLVGANAAVCVVSDQISDREANALMFEIKTVGAHLRAGKDPPGGTRYGVWDAQRRALRRVEP